jgi:tRNA dimethylallyltransferase
MRRPERRLVAVVGATATGKTRVAIALAQRFNGEIINADSRQVYRGMDIGTAKPTAAEQRAARHWLIDVADPDETYTLGRFLDDAQSALDDIWSRGKLPIVAGGTGQYVWALLEGWRVPRVAPDRALRERLEALNTPTLLKELRRIDKASAKAIHPNNRRRLIRAIEVTRATGRAFSAWQAKEPPSFASTVVGLALDREELYARIDARVEAMVAGGLVDEVRRLKRRGYSCDLPSMQSIGYREVCAHLAKECTLRKAAERIKTETHRLARMQHTWFRRDDARIAWVDVAAADVEGRAAAVVEAGIAGGYTARTGDDGDE